MRHVEWLRDERDGLVPQLIRFGHAAEPVEPGTHVLGRGVDRDGADAVRAVDEVVPGGECAVEVALAEADAADVGEDDGAGAASVEAVDVEGEAGRWNASPASTPPGNDWARLAPGWIGTAAGPSQRQTLSGGLLSLICADVIRPTLP